VLFRLLQRPSHPPPSHLQRLRQHPRLAHHRHEIGVGHPARQNVHMNVPSDPRSRGLANIHPQVDPIRVVQFPQHGLHALRKRHHLVGRFAGKLLQLVQMDVGDDHHVAGCVRIGIQDDEAVLAAMHDVHLGVIPFLRRLAEDASGGLFRGSNIGVAPRRPEVIHKRAG